MILQLGTFLSLVAALAPAKAAPSFLVERQSCVPEDRKYVVLRPGEYTYVTALDKLGADNWSARGGAGFSLAPWYFDPNPAPPARPYTVEHLAVTTYLEVPGKTWDEVWADPLLTQKEAIWDCRIEARYGISPACVPVSLNPMWRDGGVISPSQADVMTSCTRIG